jgi:hypothetical protein
MRANISSNRIAYFLLALLVLLTSVPAIILHARAWDDADTSRFDFATANVGAREVEDQTQNAIKREYAAAWKNMAEAVEQNRVDLVDQNFVGAERDRLRRQIEQQRKNGMSSQLKDISHKVEFAFYSPEGTAIELRDTVELEQQTLDGSKQVHSESTTQKYIVIFTLVEDRWKVRTLQQVASD